MAISGTWSRKVAVIGGAITLFVALVGVFTLWRLYAIEHLCQISQGAQAESTSAITLLINIGWVLVTLEVAGAIATIIVLAWPMIKQVRAATQNVQSSAAQLQAAATQQATGSREQTSALNEVTTTMKELVATSQQIADNSDQVSHMAEEASRSSATGDQTARRALEAIASIKRQMDAIARHMLELGKRSQQIGLVLDIISEMAEQTNILAINATIEAAGAGEAGQRFAVVADEVRKLADRVSASTKDIRVLVEEIRSATNTAVMATEDGGKAVDAGTRQFNDLESAFSQITALVNNVMDASKEIVLSTRQQTTAVEQVNSAIVDVTQAARENEVSTRQSLEAVAQLVALSRDLMLLVNDQEKADGARSL